MRVSSHQPSFLPWIGYWHKVASSDLHVFSAGVKFPKENYVNRVRLAGTWLTLPLQQGTSSGPIKDVKVRGLAQAADRIQRTLCVKRFPCHERLHPLLSYLAGERTSWLLEVNLETTRILAEILGLQTRFSLDSEEPKPQWAKTDNLAARILRHTNEGTYLAGGGATQYLDPITFPFPIEWQTLQPKISPESILQLIATEPNPLATIWQAGRWNVQ